MTTTLLDSSFGHTAQYTSCPDSSYAGTPQQHNVRPTVAARQPQIGRTRHALTRALDTRHATALVTTSASHNMSHITGRIAIHTHTQRQRSLPYAIVEARANVAVQEPFAEKLDEWLEKQENSFGEFCRSTAEPE